MPTSWQDIKDGDYKVALGPLTGGNAQAAFIASAYAFGGDMNNLDPAFEFWTELAKEGRINTLDITQANFESGEISVGVVWSFTGIPYSKNISQYKMQAVVPSRWMLTEWLRFRYQQICTSSKCSSSDKRDNV